MEKIVYYTVYGREGPFQVFEKLDQVGNKPNAKSYINFNITKKVKAKEIKVFKITIYDSYHIEEKVEEILRNDYEHITFGEILERHPELKSGGPILEETLINLIMKK